MIIIYYAKIKPALNNVQSINEEVERKSKELKQAIEKDEHRVEELKEEKKQLVLDNTEAQFRLTTALAKEESLMANIEKQKAMAESSAKEMMNKNLQLIQESLNTSAMELREKYLKAQSECEEEYEKTLRESAAYFDSAFKEQKETYAQAQRALDDLRAKVEAAVAAAREAQERKDKVEFYSLVISQEDKDEIQRLKSIIPYLRDAEPLAKVIWKCYYERPYNELMGRVVGPTAIKGIYKITNKSNEMCYIGQSVNIASRFKDHIKAGLGINSTSNKLYTAMKEEGVESFTYEILDSGNIDLNEREKFWINFYQSNSYGYNSTRGGA